MGRVKRDRSVKLDSWAQLRRRRLKKELFGSPRRRSLRVSTMNKSLRLAYELSQRAVSVRHYDPKSRSHVNGYDVAFTIENKIVTSKPDMQPVLKGIIQFISNQGVAASWSGLHHLNLNTATPALKNGVYVTHSYAGTISSLTGFDRFALKTVKAGLGCCYERLHLIGVSAGSLKKRNYRGNNIRIGSHALNTAMMPLEKLALNLRKKVLNSCYDVVFYGMNDSKFVNSFVARKTVVYVFQRLYFTKECCHQQIEVSQHLFDEKFFIECQTSRDNPIPCNDVFTRNEAGKETVFKLSIKTLEGIKRKLGELTTTASCSCSVA